MRSLLVLVIITVFAPSWAAGLTANKVWMEFRDNGRYRVYVNYTVPALREFREAYAEFAHKKAAERFYFDLVRGAEFYLPLAQDRRFVPPRTGPDPW